MDLDTRVERLGTGDEDDDEERSKWQRPPSSYGSMKSDDEEEEERDGKEAEACLPPIATAQPEMRDHVATGLKLDRPRSPETLYTMTTEQTNPPGAVVIDTRSCDLEDFPEDNEDVDDDEMLFAHSPEPPEPLEIYHDIQADGLQPGRLHPEQDLPHVFKSIQSVLTGLSPEELLHFKMWFYQWKTGINLQQVMEGDILDFVDRIIETLGQHNSLLNTIKALESIDKKLEAAELQNQCKRVLIRFHLTQYLIRKHQFIHEGVVQAGKHKDLDAVYVEPEITTCVYGGVDPSHEFRPHPPSPVQVPSEDTFVSVNNLFRLQKDDGRPVRTLLTTGIPGIGMTVCVGKYCLDWARQCANKDLQFIIKLSFRNLWLLRNKSQPTSTQKISIMEVIGMYYPECKNVNFLEEEDCKYLIIMDSFDCYQTPLDWENAPVVSASHTQARLDVLIVNIIRGTLLRGACLWILGRQAAVSQIPSAFIDVVTEIQGFSEEMRDEYLTRRFPDASPAIAHYKRLPTLAILARQPFVCWIMATVFKHCYLCPNYGVNPPRLTPFYINILIIQTNRRLHYYYQQNENDVKWSDEDRDLLTNMGKMALKMLERNTILFSEEDVKEHDLKLTEVTVLSGLCTELPPADGKRTFCFIHVTFQEFMAALYVFTKFRTDSENVLVITKSFTMKVQNKSPKGLIQCALDRTLKTPPGHYDLFLRFLCGLLSPECHNRILSGNLYPRNAPPLDGLDEVPGLLEEKMQSVPEERLENLKECLREMTQKDD
ncbi:protein NLRC3 [Aulostomus maculatus]